MFNKKKRGRGGYGARRNSRRGRTAAPYQKNNQKNKTNSKVLITNLDFEVTENDVKEIFQKIGRVTKTLLNFDGNGRSRGTGEIVFGTRALAEKAVQEYDRAEVDGRPMYLKLAVPAQAKKPLKKKTVVKAAPKKRSVKKQPVARKRSVKKTVRRTPSTRGRRGSTRGRSSSRVTNRKTSLFKGRSTRGRTTRGRRGRVTTRGRRGRGSGRRTTNNTRKPKTAEQLDKELEQYHKKGGGTTKSSDQLDKEMELYHIRAGQPPPRSETVAMDEAEE